ncbi:unnamed protein product, partial [Iphiclides podalirius]
MTYHNGNVTKGSAGIECRKSEPGQVRLTKEREPERAPRVARAPVDCRGADESIPESRAESARSIHIGTDRYLINIAYFELPESLTL